MSTFATYPSLTDRSVLITGGATGIGAAFVAHFAQQGARVAFLDIDERGAAALSSSISGVRHAPQFFPCDVTDIAALKNTIAAASQRVGTFGVLINNAANDRRHRLQDTTPEEFEQSIGVNLRHQYFATQAVVSGMRELGGGSVICLGSTGWMIKNAGYPMYAMAKSAIRGLVNGLARELGKDRIRINGLVPGWVITEKQRELWLDEAGEEEIRRKQCMPGYLGGDDIARAALFLASDDSRMCTGHDFIIDGGWA
ncbi:SDR family oxidoreductase [Dyella sp. 2HG41-7]|uniref:SDR family NAD(P)-dependent oxidoreductase n=1 Tax=Dyella sp. 2HG41-7 TaxID=2883239 RepID=UPI001F162532|nr:SDR family oxidoreductase [Dyella sp. 2HG41-7]